MDTWLAFVQLHCGSSSAGHLGCFSFGHYRQCWNILTCSSLYLCLVLKAALSSGNPHFLLKPQVKRVCLWGRSSSGEVWRRLVASPAVRWQLALAVPLRGSALRISFPCPSALDSAHTETESLCSTFSLTCPSEHQPPESELGKV